MKNIQKPLFSLMKLRRKEGLLGLSSNRKWVRNRVNNVVVLSMCELNQI